MEGRRKHSILIEKSKRRREGRHGLCLSVLSFSLRKKSVDIWILFLFSSSVSLSDWGRVFVCTSPRDFMSMEYSLGNSLSLSLYSTRHSDAFSLGVGVGGRVLVCTFPCHFICMEYSLTHALSLTLLNQTLQHSLVLSLWEH